MLLLRVDSNIVHDPGCFLARGPGLWTDSDAFQLKGLKCFVKKGKESAPGAAH